MSLAVYNITPFTLLDYPDNTACIVWFAGCNMRCVYCYNVDIVRGKGRMSYDEVYGFLDTRRGLLDAVVLSGGECLMHRSIESFIIELKKRNLLVKIDTNGSYPLVLSKLINEQLIDYVALDFKAMQKDYFRITRSHLFKSFEKSLELLMASKVPFEVRTTYHSGCTDAAAIKEMICYLKLKAYKSPYYLQNFFNGVPTLGNLCMDSEPLNENIKYENQLKIVIRN
jgi:pyruvate formate lyase activating enzyme